MSTAHTCRSCGGTAADRTVPDARGTAWNVHFRSVGKQAAPVCVRCEEPQHPAHGLALQAVLASTTRRGRAYEPARA